MAPVQTAEFDYHLPTELIAQQPAARREEARLLVVHRATRRIEHRRFFELPVFLRGGDQLIRNTARVRPARLFAQREGGGRMECLLLRPAGAPGTAAGVVCPEPGGRGDPGPASPGPATEAAEDTSNRADAPPPGPHAAAAAPKLKGGIGSGGNGAAEERWWCLLRPGRRLPPGATFGVAGEFTARVIEKSPTAEYLVAFFPIRAGDSVAALAERLGRVPLPPYIRRPEAAGGEGEGEEPAPPEDRSRYQTVFADRAHTVAVAAPTAGLHFSEALLADVAARGVEFIDVVLHVGLGTFRPIETEDVAAHPIHREAIEIPAATCARLAAPIAGRRIAVGTTSVRTVEHWARVVEVASNENAIGTPASTVRGVHASATDFIAEADLFIHPPAAFRVVEGLITNFHLPRSTLLCLVAAFLTPGSTEGAAWLREIYAEAIRERYRFLSYGDAMLIL